jgi:hypothetical protein
MKDSTHIQQTNVISGDTAGTVIGFALDNCVNLVIVKSASALDDTLANPDILVDDACSGIGLEDNANGEAILAGDQRAELSGNTSRQHVHDTINQVNGGTALFGLTVNKGVTLDKVGNVSNVNTDLDLAIS